MGGEDEYWNEKATVEIYSPKTNSWRSSTPMSQRRYGAAAGVVGGRLVVAGGYCRGRLSSAEAYTGTAWTTLPPMPHAVGGATACVLNGRLYVIGGYSSNKLQVLEMTEENGWSWSCKADLPATRWGAASVVHEGHIMVMGGKVDGEASSSVVVYDSEEDAWATASPLPNAKAFSVGSLPVQLNHEGEIVILRGRNMMRRDRHTSQWVTEAGRGIDHAPGGAPGALLLG